MIEQKTTAHGTYYELSSGEILVWTDGGTHIKTANKHGDPVELSETEVEELGLLLLRLAASARESAPHVGDTRKAASQMLKGGCFCGQVRYEVTGTPYHETDCHCSMCRKASASASVAWFTTKRADFRIVAGEPARFRSSARAERSFCPRCGTPLTFEGDDLPNELDVTTCSLDDPDALPPKNHTHLGSKLRWVHIGDGLPEYPASRSGA